MSVGMLTLADVLEGLTGSRPQALAQPRQALSPEAMAC